MKLKLLLVALTLMSFTNGYRGELLCSIESKKVSIFINSIYQDAETVCKESGLPMGLLIAQACLESAFGKSKIAIEKNNLIGIKLNSKYVCYDSVLECFRHWARILTSDRYKEIPLTSLNLWLYELDYNCYHYGGALYSRKIRSIYYKYNLDILDNF